MCGSERMEGEREREERTQECVCFGRRASTVEATTDGRHSRHPLSFYDSIFKLFVY